MITRIKINGFKSLLDTELYFGPFTCIAGANAVGKSNFFDALMFLSQLSDKTILEAAKSVRSENQKHANFKDIFFKNGDEYLTTMKFEVDMIVPQEAEDDLGQKSKATTTSLKYTLELNLNLYDNDKEPIEIIKEELIPIKSREARKNIYFNHKKEWKDSVFLGRGTGTPFISTEGDKLRLHQDRNQGSTTKFFAKKMPRTLLSKADSVTPTAFLARQEMRNWMMLQFEPSALRNPNSTYEIKNAEIQANGANLPATLFRLQSVEKEQGRTYQTLTNKLKELISNVSYVSVDKDDKRDLLTLQLTFKDGLVLPAQSLSDGTLRFLALAIIEQDNMGSGLICLEEPENGINPKKINEMIELLEGMATDTDYEVDEDNPLRQVIINTHSPIVVSSVPHESLYLAKEYEVYMDEFKRKVKATTFVALQDTWKTNSNLVLTTNLAEINGYLDNLDVKKEKNITLVNSTKVKKTVREHVNQLKIEY